jgi:hypothetical protein
MLNIRSLQNHPIRQERSVALGAEEYLAVRARGGRLSLGGSRRVVSAEAGEEASRGCGGCGQASVGGSDFLDGPPSSLEYSGAGSTGQEVPDVAAYAVAVCASYPPFDSAQVCARADAVERVVVVRGEQEHDAASDLARVFGSEGAQQLVAGIARADAVSRTAEEVHVAPVASGVVTEDAAGGPAGLAEMDRAELRAVEPARRLGTGLRRAAGAVWPAR